MSCKVQIFEKLEIQNGGKQSNCVMYTDPFHLSYKKITSKTICFVTTSYELKDCFNFVFLFHNFLVLEVGHKNAFMGELINL